MVLSGRMGNLVCSLAIVLAGCAGPRTMSTESDKRIVITDPGQRAAAVGERVRVVGVQTRSKIPTVCGVDVDGDAALSDKRVVVIGILERVVVDEVDPYAASRGPGTFYQVIDEKTGRLARPVPE